MGCYPIGKKLSKVVTQCYGGENSNPTYNITYSPPPTYQTTTMAKTVTFSNNNSVFIIPNEPVQGSNIPDVYVAQPEPTRPPPQPEVHKPRVKMPVKGQIRHVHAPEPHGPNQSEQAPSHGRGRFVHGPNPPSASSSEPVHGSQQPEQVPSHGRVRFVHGPHLPGANQAEPVHGQHQSDRSEHEPTQPHPGHGYAAYGYGRYVPSPLPRWAATPKRHEYFSGEYRYYPTPVREGIYSIATDANRLTTIFSEENPNACTIA